ncbi:MAG: ribosome-recycling factor [Candidatus Parcubacteria bacterium]|nr:MAG: ribosome-recycling factor [Candidatus Parcubacteria bacterium]
MIKDFQDKLAALKKDFQDRLMTIRGYKLSLGLLENKDIEVYGQKMPLKSLGLISQLDPLTFKFDPYDVNSLADIEKGLQSGDNYFTLSRQKNSLMIKFSPLTEEMRKNLIKNLHSLREDIRIKSRVLRDHYLKELKNKKDNKEISEDQFYKSKEAVDKEMDKFNKDVDNIFATKEKELL